MRGTQFDFDSNAMLDEDFTGDDEELDFMNFPEVENYMNPLHQTFDEQKATMEQVFEGVWKRVLKPAPLNAKSIDFSRHRITYHRNFFMENEPAPFDSTYLNGNKPDEVCQDLNNYLEGFLEALSTMREGESSLFIISYQKMFGEAGCMPRVLPKADILAELKVIKIDDIGNAKYVNELDDFSPKPLEKVKEYVEAGRLRAKDHFKSEEYENSIQVYQKILQALEFAIVNNETEKVEKIDLSIHILSNISLCQIKLDQARKALKTIAQIEEKCNIDNQPKILFQKGKALRLLGEFKEAAVALKKAQQLKPNDHTISKEMEVLNKSMADYDETSKNMAKKYFQS